MLAIPSPLGPESMNSTAGKQVKKHKPCLTSPNIGLMCHREIPMASLQAYLKIRLFTNVEICCLQKESIEDSEDEIRRLFYVTDSHLRSRLPIRDN